MALCRKWCCFNHHNDSFKAAGFKLVLCREPIRRSSWAILCRVNWSPVRWAWFPGDGGSITGRSPSSIHLDYRVDAPVSIIIQPDILPLQIFGRLRCHNISKSMGVLAWFIRGPDERLGLVCRCKLGGDKQAGDDLLPHGNGSFSRNAIFMALFYTQMKGSSLVLDGFWWRWIHVGQWMVFKLYRNALRMLRDLLIGDMGGSCGLAMVCVSVDPLSSRRIVNTWSMTFLALHGMTISGPTLSHCFLSLNSFVASSQSTHIWLQEVATSLLYRNSLLSCFLHSVWGTSFLRPGRPLKYAAYINNRGSVKISMYWT